MSEHEIVSAPKKKDNISDSNQSKKIPLIGGSHSTAIIQRVQMYPQSLKAADAIVLQRTFGNQSVGSLMKEIGFMNRKSTPVQREVLLEDEKAVLQGRRVTPESDVIQRVITSRMDNVKVKCVHDGKVYIATWNEKYGMYDLYDVTPGGEKNMYIDQVAPEDEAFNEISDEEFDEGLRTNEIIIAGDNTLSEGRAFYDKGFRVTTTAFEYPREESGIDMEYVKSKETIELPIEYEDEVRENMKYEGEAGLKMALGIDVEKLPTYDDLQPSNPQETVLYMNHPFTSGYPSWPTTQKSVSKVISGAMNATKEMGIGRFAITAKEYMSSKNGKQKSESHRKCYGLTTNAEEHELYPYRKDGPLGFSHHKTKGGRTSVIPSEQSRTFHFASFAIVFEELIFYANQVITEEPSQELYDMLIIEYMKAKESGRLPKSLRSLVFDDELSIITAATSIVTAANEGLPAEDYVTEGMKTDEENGDISDF